MGDLNLPGKLPEKFIPWRSAVSQFTYPSWGARVQFDHILLSKTVSQSAKQINFLPATSMVSDHLPIGIEISMYGQRGEK